MIDLVVHTLDIGPFNNCMARSCIDISMLLFKVMYYFKKESAYDKTKVYSGSSCFAHQ